MNRLRQFRQWGVAATCCWTLLAAPSLCAQGNRFSLGGGATFPTGDYSDIAKTGWHATASINFGRHDSRFGLLIDGTYGELGLDNGGSFDVRQQWIYGTGNLVFRFKRASASKLDPYIIGGAGVYHSRGIGKDADLFGDTSATDFGVNGGIGVNYALTGITLYLEGRYHTVFSDPANTHFIPLTLGIRFGR